MDSSLVNPCNEIEIIKSGRGKVLLHAGFQYYLVRKYKNSQCARIVAMWPLSMGDNKGTL